MAQAMSCVSAAHTLDIVVSSVSIFIFCTDTEFIKTAGISNSPSSRMGVPVFFISYRCRKVHSLG
jgi:hypothetical protein